MIGADQFRGALHILAFDQARAAMLADIEEDVRLPLLVAGNQQRATGLVVRHRHARLGQKCRWTKHLRQPVEQCAFLRFEMRRVGVAARGHRLGAMGFPGLPVANCFGERELTVGRAQRLAGVLVQSC